MRQFDPLQLSLEHYKAAADRFITTYIFEALELTPYQGRSLFGWLLGQKEQYRDVINRAQCGNGFISLFSDADCYDCILSSKPGIPRLATLLSDDVEERYRLALSAALYSLFDLRDRNLVDAMLKMQVLWMEPDIPMFDEFGEVFSPLYVFNPWVYFHPRGKHILYSLTTLLALNSITDESMNDEFAGKATCLIVTEGSKGTFTLGSFQSELDRFLLPITLSYKEKQGNDTFPVEFNNFFERKLDVLSRYSLTHTLPMNLFSAGDQDPRCRFLSGLTKCPIEARISRLYQNLEMTPEQIEPVKSFIRLMSLA